MFYRVGDGSYSPLIFLFTYYAKCLRKAIFHGENFKIFVKFSYVQFEQKLPHSLVQKSDFRPII